jgi:NADPH:quinone reductase-like Zn-dependent oxidoreductase
VLVLGATGTVGSIAVQLAKLLGAGQIIAVGRDPGRLRRACELGADECARLGAADAGDRLAQAADLIIDLTWGLRPCWRYRPLPPAHASCRSETAPARSNGAGGIVRSKALAILGYGNYHVRRDERLGAYRHLADLAAAGRISVELERVPLEDVALAWQRQRTGAHCKQILIPGRAGAINGERARRST